MESFSPFFHIDFSAVRHDFWEKHRNESEEEEPQQRQQQQQQNVRSLCLASFDSLKSNSGLIIYFDILFWCATQVEDIWFGSVFFTTFFSFFFCFFRFFFFSDLLLIDCVDVYLQYEMKQEKIKCTSVWWKITFHTLVPQFKKHLK